MNTAQGFSVSLIRSLHIHQKRRSALITSDAQQEVPNRLMLRWLKTVVVSDEEKAHVMRQVGVGKMIAVEASKLRQMTS